VSVVPLVSILAVFLARLVNEEEKVSRLCLSSVDAIILAGYIHGLDPNVDSYVFNDFKIT